ncbi:MAG: hypothetical protein HZA28_06300 [Candidatus Omnitrophica bacterium]|nr:hypothetical protein [Candidatus Omnitrophota bacterium]
MGLNLRVQEWRAELARRESQCLEIQRNNRKNDSSVEDFLRTLYREGFLSQQEFEDRELSLKQVCNGELKPKLAQN